MNGGIDHTPWYVRVLMMMFVQVCLAGTQYLLYLKDSGTWAYLGMAALQLLAAVAAVYGPSSAGTLAKNVGRALKIGKSSTDVTVPPEEPRDPA